MNDTLNNPEPFARGEHLQLMKRGTWEYAQRNQASAAVGIIAVTDEQKVLLVEQFRPPVGARVIELPAGLVGDLPGEEAEHLLDAAKRELKEETGYDAATFEIVATGPSSAGMTSEVVTLLRAGGLRQVSTELGAGGEELTLHAVPLQQLDAWLVTQQRQGLLVDLKVYTIRTLIQAPAIPPAEAMTNV